MLRRWSSSAALLAAAVWALPAVAQQPMPVPDLTGGGHSPMLSLPRPADTGKPIIYDPQFVTKADNDRISGCTPGSSCRLQVLGVIQNNGAVELRVSAFSW